MKGILGIIGEDIREKIIQDYVKKYEKDNYIYKAKVLILLAFMKIYFD